MPISGETSGTSISPNTERTERGKWKTLKPEPASLATGMFVTDEDRAFWAFKPITKPAQPMVKGTNRIRTPIDTFVLAKLKQQGLDFAPEAVTGDVWEHKYSRETAAFPAPYLREHKYWPPVARVDNAYGDRNLICSCPPMSELA